MRTYSFDRFRRELRSFRKPSLPLRVQAWVAGFSVPLEEIHPFTQETCRLADALGAALSRAECDDPRIITPLRQFELAKTTSLSADEISAILFAYETFAKIAADRARAWWQEMAIHAIFLIGIPIFVLTASIVFVAIGLKLVFG